MYKFLQNNLSSLITLGTYLVMVDGVLAIEASKATAASDEIFTVAVPSHFLKPINHYIQKSDLLKQVKFINQLSDTYLGDWGIQNLPSLAECFDIVVLPHPNNSQKNYPSIRAADLLLAQDDNNLLRDANSPSESSAEPGSATSAPTETGGGQLKIPLGAQNRPFSFGFGSVLRDPTALQGPTREKVVSTIGQTSSVISLAAYLRQQLVTGQDLTLQLVGDPKKFGIDLNYNNAALSLPGVFSANLFAQSSAIPVFEEGEREVDLPHGSTPWVQRLGGGIEYFQSLTAQLDAAVGLSYQRVSVRPGMFTSKIEPRDELGNRVTVSNNGQDDLLTLNLAALYNTLDDRDFPSRGSKVRFGIDQTAPVGAANILFTRLNGNFTQFIPLRAFGLGQGPQTLVLNFQGGTMIGDVPPYETFTLGGSDSVRGFDGGGVGSGSSFIQATVEYRFPLFSFSFLQKILEKPINLRGVLFVDYGDTLGTQSNVVGEPGVVRDKPGDGWGYGFGVHAQTIFGLFRLELGLNDRGDIVLHFSTGDRF